MDTIEIKKNEIEENNIETALIVKGEKSLKSKRKFNLMPILKTATGIIFYTATFVVSVALGYLFVFSVFQY